MTDLVYKAAAIWAAMPAFGESAEPNPKKPTNTGINMDPATTAALINGGSKVLGAAMSPPSATSSSSQYVQFTTGPNTIATSGSKANGAASLPWYIYAVGAAVAIVIFKRMKA